ncbi:c-type cytochrome [Seonamhaeicola maritimus]|uniref:c-type cytochrome n=1 Tax=Seonamhaeicola maritimus TaxID=2591822 RepID=UPI002495894D|nr:cytochrome c [Seonamhaeicola maritimus]
MNATGQNQLPESMERGKSLYNTNCIACHMANGEGVLHAFPPIAKSDYLMADKDRSIKVVLNGANGEMEVNDVAYYGAMAGFNYLSDQEIADIMNFIRNSWGNKGDIVAATEIKKNR